MLQHLQGGAALAPYAFHPVNLGQEPPPALPPNTAKLSQAQAHAALMGTVAKTLSELPQMLVGNYLQGKKLGTELKVNDLQSAIANGTATPEQIQAWNTIHSKGALSPLETAYKQAEINHLNAVTAAATKKASGDGLEDNPLAKAFDEPNTPSSGGGFAPNDNAFFDANGSAPTSPVKSAAAQVTASPKPVAASAPIMMPGVEGGPDLPLPASALPVSWRQSASGALSKPVVQSSTQASPESSPVVQPALQAASGNQSTMGVLAEAPKFTLDANFSGSVTPEITPVAAPGDVSAAQNPPVAPSSAEAAAKATGGRKLTDQGHFGGTVMRFPGFDREETPEAIYVYQHRVKPGSKGISVFKKPAASKKEYYPSIEEGAKALAEQGATATAWKQDPSGFYPDSILVSPKLNRDLQKRVNELAISTAGKTEDQIREEVANKLAAANQLTDAQIQHVNTLATAYKQESPYQKWSNVTDGFNNLLEASKFNSGLGDKMMIEEGQRILNPNTAVAAQTMKQMGSSKGLLEKLSPTYIAQHFQTGRIFNDREEKEYLEVIKKALLNRANEMEDTRKSYIEKAKIARVPEDAASAYFRNPYKEAVEKLSQSTKPVVSEKDQKALNWLNSPESESHPRKGEVEADLRRRGIL